MHKKVHVNMYRSEKNGAPKPSGMASASMGAAWLEADDDYHEQIPSGTRLKSQREWPCIALNDAVMCKCMHRVKTTMHSLHNVNIETLGDTVTLRIGMLTAVLHKGHARCLIHTRRPTDAAFTGGSQAMYTAHFLPSMSTTERCMMCLFMILQSCCPDVTHVTCGGSGNPLQSGTPQPMFLQTFGFRQENDECVMPLHGSGPETVHKNAWAEYVKRLDKGEVDRYNLGEDTDNLVFTCGKQVEIRLHDFAMELEHAKHIMSPCITLSFDDGVAIL
jgi:hypothetical protein